MSSNIYQKITASCTALAITIAGLTSFIMPVSAAGTPVLTIENKRITANEIGEDGKVAINLFLSDNRTGVCAASFGIRYGEGLTYCDFEAVNKAGKNFNVACNEDQHLLWMTCSAGDAHSTANELKEEIMLTLYFTLQDGISGGSFPIQFEWEGMDGSSAFWYTDRDRSKEMMQGGMREDCNNGSLAIVTREIYMEPTQIRPNRESTRQLYVYNGTQTPIWFSDNPNVATVDNNGLVTAVSPGECMIQAFVDNQIVECKVVVPEAYYYDITDSNALNLTDPAKTIIMEYPNASGTVTWRSSLLDVAEINETGMIIPKKNGSVNLFGTDTENNVTYMRPVNIAFDSVSPEDPPTETTSENVSPLEQPLSGDVNLDGTVNIMDVILLNKAIYGKASLSEAQEVAADVDESGKPDASDALVIMKKIVKLI